MVITSAMMTSPAADIRSFRPEPSIVDHQGTHRFLGIEPSDTRYEYTEHSKEIREQVNPRPMFVDKRDECTQGEHDQGDDEEQESIHDAEDISSSSYQCSCKMWTCGECNKQFTSARALKIHEVKQHENMPRRYLKCSHCDEVFDHGNLLQIHMKVHHNIKVSCPQCKDMFDHPRVLSMHLKAHHAEPVCLVCGVKFDHNKILKLHMEHYHKVNKNKPNEQEAPETQGDQESDNSNELGTPFAQERGQQQEVFTALPLHDTQRFHQRDGIPGHDSPITSPEVERVMIPDRSSLVDERVSDPRNNRQSLSPERGGFIGSPERLVREGSLSPRMLPRERDFHHDRRPFTHPDDHVVGRWQSHLPAHEYREVYPGPLFPPRGVLSPDQERIMRAELRHYGHRPLGRSRSLPSNPALLHHALVPVYPWNGPGNGLPPTGTRPDFPRDRQGIDRPMLEAVRNSLRAKLQSVEATLLEDDHRREAEYRARSAERSHSPESRDFYYPHGDPLRSYRPSVITARNSFGEEKLNIKRKVDDSSREFEPPAKERAFATVHGRVHAFGQPREELADQRMVERRRPEENALNVKTVETFSGTSTRTDSNPDAVNQIPPGLAKEIDFSSDHAKIFIKRGAPRCNLCQQTFSSKMEYLHHLISHREKNDLTDATKEELEFLEGVKRNMENMNVELQNARNEENKTQSPPNQDRERVARSLNQRDDEVTKEEHPQTTQATDSSSSSTFRPSSSPSPSRDSNAPFPNVMPFGTATCSECNDVFADSLSCRMHIEKRHMKPRCRDCGLEFDHKNLLKIHMDCYHSNLEVLQCYYCGASFKHRAEFLDHLTSHETQTKGLDTKEKAGENSNSEQTEPSGRRRWSQLVASAQLPMAPKGGIHGVFQREGNRLRAAGRGEKRKLTKTMSLPTRVPPRDGEVRPRSKDDNAREIRTRIFMPTSGDQQNAKIPLYANNVHPYARHPTNEVEMAPPFHRKDMTHLTQPQPDGRDVSRPRHMMADDFHMKTGPEQIVHSRPNDYHLGSISTHREREALSAEQGERMVPFEHKIQKMRLERVYAARERFEKERLHPSFNHKEALVKIEKVERSAESENQTDERKEERHNGMVIENKERQYEYHGGPRTDVPTSVVNNIYSTNPLMGVIHNNMLKRLHQDPPSSTAPPLLTAPRMHQSPLTRSPESSPDSSRSCSPIPVKRQGAFEDTVYAARDKAEPNGGEPKEKRRDSINKLTKEALLNSLTLKRRSSAPDLRNINNPSTVSSATTINTTQGSITNEKALGSASAASDRRTDTSNVGTANNQASNASPHPNLARRKSSRDIVCHPCGLSFGHKKLYKIHVDSYHGEQQAHKCLQCGEKSFKDKNEFLKHLMAHQEAGDKTVPPDDAGQANDTEEGVVKRIDRPLVDVNTSEPEVKQPIIEPEALPMGNGASHENSEQLGRDMSIETAEKQPTAKHHRTHKGQKDNNACFTCGKTFANGRQLEQHLSTHASINEDGQYCCSLCSKAFDTHRKLEIHSRSHTGFKPHKCELCGRCFPYYSSYYYHKMTHTKDRPHKCPLCGKGFIQTRYLRSHLKTHQDEQGTSNAEVDTIIQNMKEEGPDSPALSENSATSTRDDDEETATAEILCSFRRAKGLQNFYNGSQNSDADSVDSPMLITGSASGSEESVFSSDDETVAVGEN